MNKDITLEDLGYEKIKAKKDDICCYFNKEDNVKLTFYKFENELRVFIEDDCHMGTFLNTLELQAIYNKCKDLGWLDE